MLSSKIIRRRRGRAFSKIARIEYSASGLQLESNSDSAGRETQVMIV